MDPNPIDFSPGSNAGLVEDFEHNPGDDASEDEDGGHDNGSDFLPDDIREEDREIQRRLEERQEEKKRKKKHSKKKKSDSQQSLREDFFPDPGLAMVLRGLQVEGFLSRFSRLAAISLK